MINIIIEKWGNWHVPYLKHDGDFILGPKFDQYLICVCRDSFSDSFCSSNVQHDIQEPDFGTPLRTKLGSKWRPKSKSLISKKIWRFFCVPAIAFYPWRYLQRAWSEFWWWLLILDWYLIYLESIFTISDRLGHGVVVGVVVLEQFRWTDSCKCNSWNYTKPQTRSNK